MAEKRDYYESLGISKTASDDEIKSAYRQAAKKYHPDLHPGDKAAEERFKEVSEAYEVLSDKEKRSKYDQFGHNAFDPSAQGGYGGYGFSGSGFTGSFTGFDDILSSMFGGFSGGHRTANANAPMQGEDLRYSLSITFEEAAFGCKKELQYRREERCDSCSGTGAKAGTHPKTCPVCKGTGQTRIQQNSIFGAVMTTRVCDHCGGTGKIIDDPCAQCKGRGRASGVVKVNVNIPAGLDDGQSIRMRGHGEAGYNGGVNGDLLVTVRVKPHKQFIREGYNLYLNLSIPVTTAVLGGDVTVPTLSGTIKYGVPAGTQSGTTFRLRDQGIQKLQQSGKGDMFVNVSVEIPKKLTERQRQLYEELALSSGETPPAAKPSARKAKRKRNS